MTNGKPTAATLRPALDADSHAIAEIWHLGWRDGHLGHVPVGLLKYRELPDFRRRVPERIGVTTVALVDSQIVGFVTIQGDEVEQVYVAKEARGSGAASELLTHAEHAIAAHHSLAWLAVVAGNARARSFYERQGWRDAGPLRYEAQVPGGTFLVPSRRYEKTLLSGPRLS